MTKLNLQINPLIILRKAYLFLGSGGGGLLDGMGGDAYVRGALIINPPKVVNKIYFSLWKITKNVLKTNPKRILTSEIVFVRYLHVIVHFSTKEKWGIKLFMGRLFRGGGRLLNLWGQNGALIRGGSLFERGANSKHYSILMHYINFEFEFLS